ncbi:TetR/AcrR family transcriptional regulator [Orenia marismortui]|uniref:TetR family transcriptional regulator n=1 Tax=Orenia marismortui TaxID=46469 RepID=A0A4R8H0E4_9FIRM|nr:TetR/AcrR family transcriptional regulator [Orenia marismortui]TDX52668.1 TetR family transcriptional regulator [Orenia marismortui]
MGKEDKKNRIIQAAIELFEERGYHKTKVSEIADLAQVAKGTVYWYFESKKELFEATAVSKMNEIDQMVNNNILKFNDPIEKLRSIVVSVLNFIEKNKRGARMFRESSIAISKEFKEIIINYNQNRVELISTIIDQGIKEEKIKLNIDSQDAARILLGIVSSFNPHFYQGQNGKVTDKVDIIMEIFLKGIAS